MVSRNRSFNVRKLLRALPLWILCICGCSSINILVAQQLPAVFKQPFTDDKAQTINAHGAGVLYYNGMYYLYGEIKHGKTWLVRGQAWEDYRVPAGGVCCYASPDLVHWKYKGIALSPLKGAPESDLDTSRVVERPKVVYNPRTKKFVMWMHIDKNDYSYARAGVAISDHPQGPFHYLGSFRPNGQMSRDMTLFQDTDGKAYLIYASENNQTMQVCLLSDDYLRPTATYSRILVGRNREAPAVFHYQGKYYLITSACTGWAPNPATYSVAERIMGPWKEMQNPCTGPDADSTYHAQSTFVVPLKGRPGQFIFMADRWNKNNLPASTYLWLPMEVKDDKVVIYPNGTAYPKR